MTFKQRADFRAAEVVLDNLHNMILVNILFIDNPELVIYRLHMVEIRQTPVFAKWLRGLRDMQARARIQMRLDRVARGLFGDVKPVGEGVNELRIDHGPGYRVYFVQRGQVLVVLLCGGDKATQARDILAAKAMAVDWKE
jgi:putative addiction module killer protein